MPPTAIEARRDENHKYWAGDRNIPGFTEIATTLNFIQQNPFWTEEGRAKGTHAHDACADIDNGVFDPEFFASETVEEAMGYKGWVEKTGFKALLVEKSMASLIHLFAGTVDAFGQFPDGRYAVQDRKRRRAGKVTALQTAAYRRLVHELLGIPLHLIDRFALQNIGSGRPSMVQYTDRNDDAVWLGIVAAYHWGVNNGIFTLNLQNTER